MENQNSFVVDNSDESGDGAMATEWSELDDESRAPVAETAPASRESTRVNLAARRAIEDFQERRRLRELLGDDLLDF